MKVAILISGGGSNMVRLVESMVGDHPARPCLVLSNRHDAKGLAKASDLGIPTAVVDHRAFMGDRAKFDERLNEVVSAAGADIICLAGFMRILTPAFVGNWRGRILNIHPSLLPKYKGLNTHSRALEAGDTEAGCTVHEVTEKLDDGEILGQARVPILASDTPESLAVRVLEMEHRLYPEVLRRFVKGERDPIVLSSAN